MVRHSDAPVIAASSHHEGHTQQRNPRITQRALQRCMKNVEWTSADNAEQPRLPDLTESPRSTPTPQLNPFAAPFVPGALKSSGSSSSVLALEAAPVTGVVPPAAPLRLHVGAHMIPHPAKAHKGGEDAYFVSDDSLVFGIADGVGGWEALGVDSGLYSRSLMGFCGEAVNASGIRDPFEVLKYAHDRCACVQGSTTACVVSLLSDGSLSAVNLGDSGFIVVRDGVLHFKTKEQQHFFNCPFQIGSSRDQPEDAQRLTVENLKEGDIVIACTDGVFDNLFTEDIIRIVCESLHLGPQAIAKRVAEASSAVAQNGDAFTPFQDGALKAGQLWKGGKLDDITVIAALITRRM